MAEMVGQFGRLGDSVTPQLLPHAHQEFAALIVFAENMPPDFERAGRVEFERLHIELLHLRVLRVAELVGQFLIAHIPLLGPAMKPKPTLCLCSRGSVIICMASSRCIGGITNRSSNVQSDVSR